MQYDYFVASRWRNKAIVEELVSLLRKKEKRVYSFLEGNGSEYGLKNLHDTYTAEDFMMHFENIPDWQTDPRIKEIFDMDMNALRNSDALILLLPAGTSAHMEAGAAYGMGKKCILIGEQKETESLYLLFSETYPDIASFLHTQ